MAQDARSDWHEQDLLTNVEAAQRLAGEIVETRAALDGMPADDPRRPGLERRLRAMDESLRDLRGHPG
jgi:hypothetical protein